jgi:ATP-binding cassette subfamily B (MDR/TAP) protein 7
VHFAYDPARPILRGLSFAVPAGARVALVGPSGCGKSTVFRLLNRFYEPAAGAVRVDGQDVRGVQLASLRAAIGVVPQDTPLFHADVRHNIRYGRLDASDAEVEEAARKAQVHAAVLRLPRGYATTVGERGALLSGGEKQRLAVARVLLRDARVVLFDEATSALDGATEAELMGSIRAMLREGKRTSVFVAHRLRTVVDAGTSAGASVGAGGLISMSRSDHRAEGGQGGGAGHARGADAPRGAVPRDVDAAEHGGGARGACAGGAGGG